MNLALHGFLLQVFVSILDFRHGRLLCSAGEPGYLDFDNLPETNFSCQGKVIGGYYADVEAGCQMFHVCTIGQKDEIMDIKFLCLNGTVFDQETRVCERVDEVDCSKSERFYNLNLELYGNNAVTLSLNGDDEDDLTIDPVEIQPRTTSARPSTTSTTSTTTSRPNKPSTTAASGSFQHPAGYPQHYQPQPPFPQVHTSQSKSLYDDKNGGYHHQYIFHNSGERASNQATSYQLFSNQGAVSSTTVPPAPPPPPPQIHQIRYSSTVGPPPQIIHSEPSTVTPLFATSSTIQTLLNSNANNPVALINPIFHNHGIASTTEQFTVHSNNPRETTDYRDDDDQEQDIRALEAIQSVNKGKISKLTISPVPSQQESSRIVQTKTSQQQQQRISGNFLPTPTIETTMRSFYPTPRPSPKPSHSSQSVTHQVTQHIHVPQLKPHQITINLPPPDIQRIVQNPSPLLPSQSRVIVTAKASVSDESGRPLNTTQLVTLPLPTIPASYDDYKEGDESFDPFYRDVPKIRKNRQNPIEKIRFSRAKRSLEQPYHFVYGTDSHRDFKMVRKSEPRKNEDNAINKESTHVQVNLEDFRALKESLIKFRDILFNNDMNEDSSRNDAEENKNNTERIEIDSKTFDPITTSVKRAKDNAIKKVDYLEDLKTEASKHFNLNKNTDKNEEEEDEKMTHEDSSPSNIKVKIEKSLDERKHIKDTSELEIYIESTTVHPRKKSQGDVIDLIILDSNNDSKVKATSAKTDAPIEIVIEKETKSRMHDASKTDGKVTHRGQIAGSLIKNDSEKRSNSVVGEKRQLAVPRETIKRNGAKENEEQKSGPRRKGSRPRPSKRRISSRIRQQRMENVEPTEAIRQKERITTSSTTATTIIDTTTVTSTSTTTTAFTTTVTPSVAAFEKKVAEQIDSNIFGDSESQTFKELDTRAIGQHDAIYSKSLQNGKSHDVSKSKDIERLFDRQIVEDHTRNSELHADKMEEEKRETESTNYTEEDTTDVTENPNTAKESTEVTHVTEKKSSTEEEDSYKEYEFPDDDDDDADTNEGEIEGNSQDGSSKISSDEVTTSREDNLEEESSYHEDANEKSSTDISDEGQSSTANYSEEVNSEELNEYQDITESSAESTRAIKEDYREYSESTEDSTMDYANSEEYTDSQEDVATSTEEADGSTEGVLKFTDELPVSDDNEDDNEDDEETTEELSNESGAHDYVDDNYEPENYKGKSNESEEDKSEEKNAGEKKDTSTIDLDRTKNIVRSDDSIEAKMQTDHVAGVTEVKDLQEIASLTTTSSATTPELTTTTMSTTVSPLTVSSTITSTATASISTTSTTESTTTASTSTTITTPRSTTTRRPKTTTPRATPPKLFKPTGNKRIYAYIPPTTTPNPVVIKSRMGLFNPKPAKPIKSYNELAPKPMIRKIILPTRKSTTTTEATTITTTEMVNTENPEMITEPVTITTAMTATSTTAATTTTTVVTTTAAAMTTAATTTTTAATTTTMATMATATTESSKNEENGLESKLETNEYISLDFSAKNDQTNKEDQLPSSSEQNISADSSKTADPGMTTKIETFTPYPLSKLSTLVPSIEQPTKEIYVKPQETTENIDTLVPTTIPPTTLLSEKSEYTEITPSTEKYLEITETTITSTSKVYQQETSLVSSVPPVPERATSISVSTTILPKAEDSDPNASMDSTILSRSNNRKLVKSRKPASFNCLEKEMYRFYGDFRDCRLFHYCSPGFTSRQVLDFRFVCEEGTAFDEVTQSCRHEMTRNRKCRNRSW